MAEKSKKNIDERKTQQPSGWKGWHVLIPSVAGILGIIIGLMGRPLLDQYILVPNAIVAKINGQSITLQQYETYAKLSRVEEVNYYQRLSQYINLYTQYGMTVSTSLTQQLNQIQTELTDSKTFGQSVLSKMIDNVLLESEAKKLGISVTDDEITKLLQDSFGYYPNGSPTPQTTPTGYIEPTLSGTQQVLLFTPTSTPDLNPTATSTPGEAPTATPTMEPTVILPTPTEGPSPTPAPSATPLSLQDYQTAFNTYMSQLTPYGLTEADLRMYVYYQLLYKNASA